MKVGTFFWRWRWLCALGTLLSLLLALLLWALWPAAGAGDSAPKFASLAVSPLRAMFSAVPPQPSVPTAPGSAIPPGLDAERSDAGEQMQLCGGAWVKVGSDGTLDQADLERAARLPEVRQRILAAMRADASDAARAVSLWVVMLSAGEDARVWRDALVQRAVSGNDPSTYALAFNSCGRDQRTEGFCAMLSAAQWARLDPENTGPWLAILADAKQRKDRAAENEALHRLATAHRSELGTFTLPGLVVNAAPDDDVAVLAAWAMATEMIGAAAAWGMPGYQHVMEACKGTALRDANRRQTCAGIAEVFSEHSDTVLERMFGAHIGEQAGWPTGRSERLRAEYAAYMASLMAANASGEGQPGIGCAALRRDLDGLRRRARLGEPGVVREWVAQSGTRPVSPP